MINTPDEEIGNFDQEIINEFSDEFQDAYDSIQEILIELESSPDNQEKLHALFRILHSVKGNLLMLQLQALSDYVHTLEDILDDMRGGTLRFNNYYSDLFLLAMDYLRDTCRNVFAGIQNTESDLVILQNKLQQIHDDQNNSQKHLMAALAALDPAFRQETNDSSDANFDLDFFKRLADFFEYRSPHEAGYTERILTTTQGLNELAGAPVDESQLNAAVYLHDVGMAFLTQDVVHKSETITPEEHIEIQHHLTISTNLLEKNTNWKTAYTIIKQHHERFDGQGYPDKLSGDEITDGAKILAIADTFEAMTHERAYRQHKRPILRAIAEINSNSGTQFDQKWVEYFNQWVRKRYTNS